MYALGGCAVPAALALLRSPRPVGRAYGMRILSWQSNVTLADSIGALVADAASFAVDHSCYFDRDTVGHHAKAHYARMSRVPADRHRIFEAALSVSHASDLINGIQAGSRARAAATWDEWWDEVRPHWRDWWRLAGNGPYPPDHMEWWNSVREYSGFRVTWADHSEPRTVLTVTGPPGTRCRVESGGAVVAEGEPPLEVSRDEDSVAVALRLERETREDYHESTFSVFATLPDGRSFRQEHVLWDDWEGERWRITFELLPELKSRSSR